MASQTSATSYKPTQYEDASWDIFGEVKYDDTFTPMQVSVLKDEGFQKDPMFPEYGEISEHHNAVKRWHLPEDRAYKDPEKTKIVAEQNRNLVSMEKKELELLINEAEEKARNRVLEEQEQELNKRLIAIKEHVDAIFKDMRAQIDSNLERIERDSVGLALEISRRIIETSVEINPEYILEIVNCAIRHAGTADVKQVRISPDDFEFIEVLGIKHRIKDFQNMNFIADSTVRSGCVVETSAGEIDFQLDHAWERIRDKVVKVIKGE